MRGKGLVLKSLLFVGSMCLFFIVSQAFGMDCNNAGEYFEKAVELKSLGSDPLALEQREELYKKAVAICPKFSEAWIHLGEVYEIKENYPDAVECYETASQLAPDLDLYEKLGHVYLKIGKFKESALYYKKVVEGKKAGAVKGEDVISQERLRQKDFIFEEVSNINIQAEEEISNSGSVNKSQGFILGFTDKAELEKAGPQLEAIAKALSELEIIIEIRAHTDVRGTEEYNQRLSERRAQAVMDYLVSKNVRRDKLVARGYGERFPLCHEDTEACHAINRRVEIVILSWK